MTQYFSLFKNNNRKTDKAPNYVLFMSEGGGELKKVGAGWIKTSKKGTSYISISMLDWVEINIDEGKREVAMKSTTEKKVNNSDDDNDIKIEDIPF